MKKLIILNSILFFVCLGVNTFLNAQTKTIDKTEVIQAKITKPFKFLTNERQITIQSKQNIRMVMVWTISGHRIVEARNINQPSFTFTIYNKEKIFFVMIEFADGKRFSEKTGTH